jgi:hypothetical protein
MLIFKILILVKIMTYYCGFRRAYYHQKLKKVCVREGELKIKLEKERVRGTERETKNFFIKKTREGEEQ